MEALTSVNVAHNKITRLPAEIGELANLTDVDMYAPFPCADRQCAFVPLWAPRHMFCPGPSCRRRAHMRVRVGCTCMDAHMGKGDHPTSRTTALGMWHSICTRAIADTSHPLNLASGVICGRSNNAIKNLPPSLVLNTSLKVLRLPP